MNKPSPSRSGSNANQIDRVCQEIHGHQGPDAILTHTPREVRATRRPDRSEDAGMICHRLAAAIQIRTPVKVGLDMLCAAVRRRQKGSYVVLGFGLCFLGALNGKIL